MSEIDLDQLRQLVENAKQTEKENNQMLKGDESFFAEHLASKIKSKHSTIRYSKQTFIEDIESSIFFNDDILFHSNSKSPF